MSEEQLTKATGKNLAEVFGEISEEITKQLRREVTITYATAAYYQEHERWPNNLGDFPSSIKESIAPATFDEYTELNFIEMENGDVIIIFIASDDKNENIRRIRISKEQAVKVTNDYLDTQYKLLDHLNQMNDIIHVLLRAPTEKT